MQYPTKLPNESSPTTATIKTPTHLKKTKRPSVAAKRKVGVDLSKPRRKRITRPYPASSFQEALGLAQEILKHAPDGKIRRLTFLKLTDRSATSSATHML